MSDTGWELWFQMVGGKPIEDTSSNNDGPPAVTQEVVPTVEAERPVGASETQAVTTSPHAAPTDEAQAVGTAHAVHSELPRFALWVPHVVSPMAPFRHILGHVARAARVGSFCTGAGPEHLLPKCLDIPCVFPMSCDNKDFAYRFMRSNKFITEHHWVDANELFTQGVGRCAVHGFGQCQLELVGKLDVLVAGITCQPYSTARSTRFTGGTLAHDEASLVDRFVDAVRMLQPKKAVLENVMGFLMAESSTQTKSPYKQLVDKINKDLPGYVVTCYILNSQTFMAFHRRRAWIILTHCSAGGAASMALQTRMIKDGGVIMVDQCYIMINDGVRPQIPTSMIVPKESQ